MNAAHSFSRSLLPLALVVASSQASMAAVDVPGAGVIEKIDFERHIMGLFSKMGCNSGSCHGSFQGKNGFRLSLFGYDPERDIHALTRDNLGRRLDPVNPEQSLLLLKATGAVLHEGGARFAKDSWQYRTFREWIENGAQRQPGSGDIRQLTIAPAEYAFRKPGETGQLTVTARFADGTEENITPFCDFRIQDDAVAEVSSTGQVTSRRAGDTAIAVLYRGKVNAVRVLVPFESPPGFQFPKLAENNFIDQLVFAKLKRLNMVPSELGSDLEFLRRVTIDTIGCLPSPDEVREFVNDQRADKRERKIDELLKHPLHAALWATKFSDITGNNTDLLENPQQQRTKLSQMWHDWFAKRLRDNMPYDEIVKGVLTATSRDHLSPEEWLAQTKKLEEEMGKGFVSTYAEKPTLDLFWRRQQQVPVEMWGEKVAAAFLGVRLECAQCHKHPTDRWTRDEYWGFANIFGAVAYPNNAFSSPELKKLADAENVERRKPPAKGGKAVQRPVIRELFLGKQGMKPNPDTGKAPNPKPLGGPEIAPKPGMDLRAELFKWMKQPDNPFFARSFVNRVWAHYFGIGIVEPVDDFSQANPPSNPVLLDALARDFVEHHYDIRRLERAVLMSRTYQLASKPNDSNRLDRRNFSHAQIRPLMAEVVVDVLNSALGITEAFGNDAPSNVHMVQVGASRIANGNLNYVLRIFGRPPRTTACDCERAMDPALPQTLYRMTDQSILGKLRQKDGRLPQLLRSKKTDAEIFEELFLAALTRFPTASEKEAFEQHRASETNRETAFVDALWALINTREFILNH
jgi:Protein of unknown function (DUF1549)/Protein of unknown function (DUF1553)